MKRIRPALTCALSCFLILLHPPLLSGQEALHDSIGSWLKQRVHFSTNGGAGQIVPLGSDRVLIPDVIWNERKAHDPYHSTEKKQTDWPFRHAAFWGKLETSARIFHQNKLSIGFLVEHRGESFGVYSLKNLVVLPLIKIEVDDSLHIGHEKISVKVQTGYLEKVLLDEGLMFYNIDAQGTLIRLRGGKYALEFDVLGDLFEGIGLGIDDAIQVRAKRFWGRLPAPQHSLSLTLSKFTRLSQYTSFENPVMPSLSYAYKRGRLKAGAQITVRTGNPKLPIPGYLNIGLTERLGAKAGVAYSARAKNYSFNGTFDCRYYGRFFNADNYNPNRTYRDFNKPIWGNYKGEHLYPLKNYFYDFSQWAVFTEYGIREIGAASLVAKADVRLWKWLWFSNYLDFNVIAAEGTQPFLYPFYRSGFSVHFNATAVVELFATNKTMNMDVHYNTFYLTAMPYLGLVFKYRMDE